MVIINIYLFIIVEMLSLGVHYLFIFWACGLSRGIKLFEEGKSWLEEITLLKKKT